MFIGVVRQQCMRQQNASPLRSETPRDGAAAAAERGPSVAATKLAGLWPYFPNEN
jgi:hypothetical protein